MKRMHYYTCILLILVLLTTSGCANKKSSGITAIQFKSWTNETLGRDIPFNEHCVSESGETVYSYYYPSVLELQNGHMIDAVFDTKGFMTSLLILYRDAFSNMLNKADVSRIVSKSDYSISEKEFHTLECYTLITSLNKLFGCNNHDYSWYDQRINSGEPMDLGDWIVTVTSQTELVRIEARYKYKE